MIWSRLSSFWNLRYFHGLDLYKATLFQVRSKSLLEKDNKKLQAEIERLKDEFQKMQEGGQPAPEIMNSILSVRKDSVSKESSRRRKSSVATVVEVEEDMATDEEKPEKPVAATVKSEEVREREELHWVF